MDLKPEPILSDDPIIASMVNHFQSDHSHRPLQGIVSADGSPIGYSCNLLKDRRTDYFARFAGDLKDRFPSLPKILKDAWVFDKTLQLGVLYRFGQVEPDNADFAQAMYYTTAPARLLINVTYCPSSFYCGLIDFKRDMLASLSLDGPIPAVMHDVENVGIVRRLLSVVGNMDDADWLLHNPLWFACLSADNHRLEILRGFLSVSTLAYLIDDGELERTYSLDRLEVIDHMETFIDLVESSHTTQREILTFLGSVEHYSLDVPHPTMMFALHRLPYREFTKHLTIKNREIMAEHRTTMDKSHRQDWVCLSELDDGVSMTALIHGDLEMVPYVEDLIQNHKGPILTNMTIPASNGGRIKLPSKKHPLPAWTLAATKDLLFQSLVEWRCWHFDGSGEEFVQSILSRTSHCLLNIDDGDQQYLGLPSVGTFLRYHVHANLDKFSEREAEIWMLIIWAWDELHLHRPEKIRPSLQQAFASTNVRRAFRRFFFTIIEVLNFPDDQGIPNHLKMSRDEFFTQIENLCDYLTSDTSEEEIVEFMTTMPMIQMSTMVNFYEYKLWTSTMASVLTFG